MTHRIAAALLSTALFGGVAATASVATAAGSLSGQGSTFVSNFLDQCKADVQKANGLSVTYQPTGSGAGRNGFIEGTVDFAASDVPFTKDEAAKATAKPYVYVPIVAGGIAVAFNVPGVKELTLSGPTLAKIFVGKIVSWNDPQIAKENPGVKLPKLVMRVVVRSDSSGTSNVFSGYLASVAKDVWKKGATSTFPVPATVGVGQKGSDGVGNYVSGPQGKGAITYAEVSFANERKLGIVSVLNAAGKAVQPGAASVSASLSVASISAENVVTIDALTKNAAAYPISAVAYLIAPKSSKKSADVKAFAQAILGDCQGKAAGLGYAPLPANVLAASTKAIASVN